MAENAPQDSSRGMPFYEKLRRDLRETLQKKRILDQSIASLEDNIYRIETSYLEETTAGNIIKGFDNYIKGSTGASTLGAGGTATRRKGGITDADRIFSRSSASFESSQPPSATSTPSHGQTPSSFPHSARESNHPTPTSTSARNGLTNNKKKKAPDDDEIDIKSTKRGKISYGRD